MSDRVVIDGLQVDRALKDFVDAEALPGTGIAPDRFWDGFSAIVHDLAPKNRALLAERDALQEKIDAWHRANGAPSDLAAYEAFLRDIGYLLPEGPDFHVATAGVDAEIAAIPGPQLVVPVMNARYALNAANARWGSLYDALYGTDALGDLPKGGGYDPARGARVVAWAKDFLDASAPLEDARWQDVTGFTVTHGCDDSPTVAMRFQIPPAIADAKGVASRPGRYVTLWRPDAEGRWKCYLEIHSPRPDDGSEGP